MQYPVKRLLRSRKTKKGIQFLVEWDGVDLNGEPWPASWEFRRNINKAALDEFLLKKKEKKQYQNHVKYQLVPRYHSMI